MTITGQKKDQNPGFLYINISDPTYLKVVKVVANILTHILIPLIFIYALVYRISPKKMPDKTEKDRGLYLTQKVLEPKTTLHNDGEQDQFGKAAANLNQSNLLARGIANKRKETIAKLHNFSSLADPSDLIHQRLNLLNDNDFKQNISEAIRSKDNELVKLFLSTFNFNGCYDSGLDTDNKTPLSYGEIAVKAGNCEAAKMILQEPREPFFDSNDPMKLAIDYGQTELAKDLFQNLFNKLPHSYRKTNYIPTPQNSGIDAETPEFIDWSKSWEHENRGSIWEEYIAHAAWNGQKEILDVFLKNYSCILPSRRDCNSLLLRNVIAKNMEKVNVDKEETLTKFSNSVKLLLDYAQGLDFSRLLDELHRLQAYLIKDVTGFNFVGISMEGVPIDQTTLRELGFTGTDSALVSLKDIENEPNDRKSLLTSRVQSAIELIGGKVNDERIVDLVPFDIAVQYGNLASVKARMEKDIDINGRCYINGDSQGFAHVCYLSKNLEVSKCLAEDPRIDEDTLSCWIVKAALALDPLDPRMRERERERGREVLRHLTTSPKMDQMRLDRLIETIGNSDQEFVEELFQRRTQHVALQALEQLDIEIQDEIPDRQPNRLTKDLALMISSYCS